MFGFFVEKSGFFQPQVQQKGIFGLYRPYSSFRNIAVLVFIRDQGARIRLIRRDRKRVANPLWQAPSHQQHAEFSLNRVPDSDNNE
ncbi:hypothetical protein, partial [Pseudomonas viridiflava]|uniref:hypothetical protein n=1 Tax=Pseudomonas viridiflava TaxID=33069 RepID=UPI0019CFEDBD